MGEYEQRKRKRRTFTMEDVIVCTADYVRPEGQHQPVPVPRAPAPDGGADPDLGAAPARASALVAVLDEGATGDASAPLLDDGGR